MVNQPIASELAHKRGLDLPHATGSQVPWYQEKCRCYLRAYMDLDEYIHPFKLFRVLKSEQNGRQLGNSNKVK